MYQVEYQDLKVSWPDEEDRITLVVVGEEDEAVDITDTAIPLSCYHWGKSYFEGDEKEGTPYAEISYPEKMRIYYKKKRISLEEFHTYVETGLNEAIKTAVAYVEENIDG